VTRSRAARLAADVVVRRFGVARFLGPVVRIMIDAWGIDYLDLDAVLRRMPNASPLAWANGFGRRADYYATRASEFEARGMAAGARSLYGKAALYYHAGQYVLSDDSTMQRQLASQSVNMHHQYGRLCDPPIQWLALPFQEGVLHAYLQLPRVREVGQEPWPVVVVVPGLGSTKVQPDYRVEELLARGMAVCVVDLPGHGASRETLRLTVDSYQAVSTVIDALDHHSEVDTGHLALLGTSLGATVVLHTAATDSRPRAIVAVAGFFEPADWYARSARYVDGALRFVMGDLTGATVRRLVQETTLRGRLGSIKADVLTIHGDQDQIIPVTECRLIAAELPSVETHIVPTGDHGVTNVPEYRLYIADWLALRLVGGRLMAPVAPVLGRRPGHGTTLATAEDEFTAIRR